MQGQQRGESSRSAQFGSQVTTATPSQNESGRAGPSQEQPTVLRLRGAAPRNAPRVQWEDDVVDNEHMGKKKSKICCIYHKPKAFDESSSDDSSSSESSGSSNSSDEDDPAGEQAGGDAAAQADGGDGRHHHHSCGHKHRHRHGQKKGKQKQKKGGGSSGSMVEIDKGKRNAYETQPTHT